ncbi:MAG: peptidoglycan recognition family protein [Candidatus Sumerlaeia bacterium]|nr:peptidoglycan recognition family protein [Candidatus Sumerlaeia bacterium]
MFCTTGCSFKQQSIDSAKTQYVKLPRPAMVSPAEWGSEPDSLVGREHTPTYLTIHHAGVEWKPTDDPVAKLKGLQSWGKRDKSWPDVPYHFLISPDGRIFEGRSIAYEPETNTSFDTNGHVNIHLWGNTDVQRATLAQLESTVAVAAWVSSEYGVSPETLGGHKDRVAAGETSCPGTDVARYIDSGLMKTWVVETLEGKTPEIQLMEPAEGGPIAFVGE